MNGPTLRALRDWCQKKQRHFHIHADGMMSDGPVGMHASQVVLEGMSEVVGDSVPAAVRYLTAGADVAADRIEIQVTESHVMAADGYESLADVLRRAFEQAARGKGAQRHAQSQPFDDQPMQQICRLVGPGFATGQAMKKLQEAQRLTHDAAIREMLGAIVYIAGAIIHQERQHASSAANDNQPTSAANAQ